MARRIGAAPSPTKKRRHSLGPVRASPRRHQSRLSLPAPSAARALSDSSSSESEAPEERLRTPPVTRQSTPASSGTKSAVSSAASSRRGRPVSSLQTLVDSLGRPPAAEAPAAEDESEPENEPPSAQEDTGRQLRFDEEETDSDESDAPAAAAPAEAEAAAVAEETSADDGVEEEAEAAPAVELPAGAKARRRTKFWSEEEEECLRRGVQQFGAGKWKLILEAGRGVFSSHRTNIDLKDKWKNLQNRSDRPRGRRHERARASSDTEAPAADAAAVEEIDSSDEEDSQEEGDQEEDPPAAPAYTATIFSPHADHSYEVEVVSYYDSGAERANAAASTSAVRAAPAETVSAKSKTLSAPPSEDLSRGGARAEENSGHSSSATQEMNESSAIAKTPEPASSARRTLAKKPPVRRAKVADTAAATDSVEKTKTKKTHKAAARVVEFEFVTDATFPKATSLKVDLANCQDVSTLKDLLRGDLLQDAPDGATVQIVGISSRCLVKDDEATDACIEKHGRAFYLLY